MDIDSIIQNVIEFTQDNIIVSVVVGIFLLFLLFRHTKILLFTTLFFMVAYGLAWLFEMLSHTGLG